MAEAPQWCPECKESLADPTVPRSLKKSRRHLFTVALVDLLAPRREGRTAWICPRCQHKWYGSGNFYSAIGT